MLDQTITAEQALRALTINAAYANFQDDALGSLTPGKLADRETTSPAHSPIPSVDQSPRPAAHDPTYKDCLKGMVRIKR